jgi:hypothetical protein
MLVICHERCSKQVHRLQFYSSNENHDILSGGFSQCRERREKGEKGERKAERIELVAPTSTTGSGTLLSPQVLLVPSLHCAARGAPAILLASSLIHAPTGPVISEITTSAHDRPLSASPLPRTR